MSIEDVCVERWARIDLPNLNYGIGYSFEPRGRVSLALQVYIPIGDEFPNTKILDAVDELRKRYDALCNNGVIDAARLYQERIDEANKALGLGEAAGED